MNDNVWELLQIEPTADREQIKKAYARQSRIFHPEEDPEGFMRLREAYSQALQWAEGSGDQLIFPDVEEWEQNWDRGQPQDSEANRDMERPLDREAVPEEDRTPLVVLRPGSEGPNPYRGGGAHRAFQEVYKKENQKNWKLWMEYMTSPEFLAAAREEDFCALIKETVREKEPEFRPGPEFVKSLYIAYCFSATDVVIDSFFAEDEAQAVTERRFHQEQSYFTVPEPIFEIAREYPIPRKMTGNDYTMKAAFANYYYLRTLDEGTGWTEQGLQGLRPVLERYALTYITDKYTGNEMTEYARHPLGLRLLNYFFDTAELNIECCRMAWEILGLKQAVMGRNKVLYGRLREICLKRYPVLNGEEPESFANVNRDYRTYVEHKGGDPKQGELEAEKFFGREDVKRALRSRRYVETYVLKYWIDRLMSPAFLRRMRALYEADMTLPCARQVLQSIAEAEESRRVFCQNEEDADAPATDGTISVNYRPFLRYWLNTAFRDFRELRLFLQEQLPYSPEWAGRLLDREGGQERKPVCRRIVLDGMEIEVRMHLYYVEYRVNGKEVFSPFLTYGEIEAMETEELLLLLPMAVFAGDMSKSYLHNVSACPEGRELAGRLRERLAETALPRENRVRAAEYLSAELMQRFFDRQNAREGGGMSAQPLRIYRETEDILYCAEWRQDERMMCLYTEQGQEGMLRHSSETYDFIGDEAQAVTLGKELLERMIAPPSIDCSCMERLPKTVYVSRFASPVRVLANEDITAEALNGLLEQFAQGGLNRLEFSFAPRTWELKAEEAEGYPRKRALVFLRQEQGYSCFYFDDASYLFFALMKRSGSMDSAGAAYVLLTQKNLPRQCIFTSFDPIGSNLEEILRRSSKGEISLEKNRASQMKECVWRAAWGGVYIQDRRVKYNLAKQELGRFPLERACNSVKQPVRLDQEPEVLNRHPLELERRTQAGAVDIIQVNGIKKALFSETVKRFFQGDVVWLRLSWDVSSDEYRKHFAPQFFENILARRVGKPMQSHIVLRRDGERYTLLCMQDLAERAEYYVADKRAYMDVEGRKYQKESFMGKTMPAYLIHRDPVPIRNRLDLLLDYMECLIPVTDRFAEFASEKPGKTRDYDAVREELVRENAESTS